MEKIVSHIASLSDLAAVVESLTDEQYSAVMQGHSSIGEHVRHVIEYCDGFLDGMKTGEIDYDARRRDKMLSQNRQSALDRLQTLQPLLSAASDDTSPIPVKEAVNAGEESPRACSTVRREYIFIAAHIVHHLAIIKLLAAGLDIALGEDVGKAASTVVYERDNV